MLLLVTLLRYAAVVVWASSEQ